MRKVVVEKFGGPQELNLLREQTPEPGPGQVMIRQTSIGLNHADLMGRRGEYKLSTGDPPYTPGIEGGGIIKAIGEGVDPARIGQRVTLAPDAPRKPGNGGTYRCKYICDADDALPVPDALPDDQLGAIWLPYLTAWGCLVWKHGLKAGSTVAMPAASSSAALAAAQVARRLGCTTIGMTTSPDKADDIREAYDHLVITHETDGGQRVMRKWHRDLKQITDGQGVDLFYDPVASGAYLDSEVRSLANGGTVWVYGLLGEPGTVDVTPLIRKSAAIRGWANDELINAGRDAWMPGVKHIFEGFEQGYYRQHIGGTFALNDVQKAHTEMEKGGHVGKLVMVP